MSDVLRSPTPDAGVLVEQGERQGERSELRPAPVAGEGGHPDAAARLLEIAEAIDTGLWLAEHRRQQAREEPTE